MELIDLKADIRQGKGKSLARSLRRNNAVPAVLYGAQTEPLSLSVATPDLDKIIRENGSSGVFLKLTVDGDTKKFRTVILREVQMDTFDLNYLHADFNEIDMSETLSISVPIEVVGEAKGVVAGGMVQIIRRELDVICRPADVPEVIQIDVTDLDIGDSVHVNEIDPGENVEIPYEVEFTILTIVPPTAEEKEVDEELAEGLEEPAVDSEEEDAGKAEPVQE
ncbi:MAG: 50S ribosomal protein L25 [Desulfobacteraceae bacterium]